MSSLTAVAGLKVGHWTDLVAATGCTMVLCPEEGAVASAEIRGSAPATRETRLLEPERTVERVHAIVLAGGSAFGLDAASGVMRWLEEHGRGFLTPFARVPIVPAAAIFDLGYGRADVRPTAEAGYLAAAAASTEPVPSGRIGAGTGARCGTYLGYENAEFGGLGSASMTVEEAIIAALVVANPRGDIVDENNQVVAGARLGDGGRPSRRDIAKLFASASWAPANTTLAVVATDAPLTKVQCKVLASSAQSGIAQATRPAHTIFDGDAAFALSTAAGPSAPLGRLAVAAQEVVSRAIVAAARASN